MHRLRRPTGLLLGVAAASLTLAASAHAVAFSNATPITINDASPPPAVPAASTPYPSAISLSGITGPVTAVSATLHGFAHDCPTDVDMLLVGPRGQESILMSDSGDCNETPRAPVDLAFSTGGQPIPCLDTGTLPGGTYAPTDRTPADVSTCDVIGGDEDVFSSPAPAGPYPVGLVPFNGVDPNGTWNLYTMDQYNGDAGSIGGGWSLDLTIAPATLAGAPTVTGKPDVGNVLTAVSGPIGNGGAPAYQWSRCNSSGAGCTAISGATAGTYKPQGADRGHTLIVTETAANSGGPSAPLASKHTAAVGPAVISSGATKKSQKVLKQKGLLVSLRSNIAASLVASATVSVPNGAKTVRFKTIKKKLRAGKTTKAKLKLSRGARRTLASALGRGVKLRAKLKLVVIDASGGRSTKKVTVRLKH